MPTQNLELIRLDHLRPEARQALCELFECIKTGFTGDFRLDFTKGVPVVRRRTETVRYGKVVGQFGEAPHADR